MLKGVTQKQIIVLYVLILFLVIVLGVRYIIMPMMETNDEKETTLAAKQDEYSALLLESVQAENYEEMNAELEQKIDELSQSFLTELKTTNVESAISELISRSGMTAVSVSLSDASDVTDASLSDSESTDGESSDGSTVTSSVKSMTSAVTAKGSYSQLVEFINLIGQTDCMYMKDLTFTMKVEEGQDEEITVNFSVVSFVYTPEEEAEETTEETTAEEAADAAA